MPRAYGAQFENTLYRPTHDRKPCTTVEPEGSTKFIPKPAIWVDPEPVSTMSLSQRIHQICPNVTIAHHFRCSTWPRYHWSIAGTCFLHRTATTCSGCPMLSRSTFRTSVHNHQVWLKLLKFHRQIFPRPDISFKIIQLHIHADAKA